MLEGKERFLLHQTGTHTYTQTIIFTTSYYNLTVKIYQFPLSRQGGRGHFEGSL